MSLSVLLCIARWERQLLLQYRAFSQSEAMEGRQLNTRPHEPQNLEALLAMGGHLTASPVQSSPCNREKGKAALYDGLVATIALYLVRIALQLHLR